MFAIEVSGLSKTYTLRIARLVTLSRIPLVELVPDIMILATEAVFLVSIGYFLLKRSFRVAKIKGSLIR